MAETRDELALAVKNAKQYWGDYPSDYQIADFAIDHALSRETELRRQIADELIASVMQIRDAEGPYNDLTHPFFEAGRTATCTKIIDELIKLRGNK